jgi:hypothetical protein
VRTSASVPSSARHRAGSPRASPGILVLVTRMRRFHSTRPPEKASVIGCRGRRRRGRGDEHALNEGVTDLEHVTPAAGAPVLHACAPRPKRVGGGRSGSSPEPCAIPHGARSAGVMPRWHSRRRTTHSHGQRQLTLARAGVVRAGPRMRGHPATFTVSEAAVRGSSGLPRLRMGQGRPASRRAPGRRRTLRSDCRPRSGAQHEKGRVVATDLVLSTGAR